MLTSVYQWLMREHSRVEFRNGGYFGGDFEVMYLSEKCQLTLPRQYADLKLFRRNPRKSPNVGIILVIAARQVWRSNYYINRLSIPSKIADLHAESKATIYFQITPWEGHEKPPQCVRKVIW